MSGIPVWALAAAAAYYAPEMIDGYLKVADSWDDRKSGKNLSSNIDHLNYANSPEFVGPPDPNWQPEGYLNEEDRSTLEEYRKKGNMDKLSRRYGEYLENSDSTDLSQFIRDNTDLTTGADPDDIQKRLAMFRPVRERGAAFTTGDNKRVVPMFDESGKHAGNQELGDAYTSDPATAHEKISYWDSKGTKNSVRVPASGYNDKIQEILAAGGTLEDPNDLKGGGGGLPYENDPSKIIDDNRAHYSQLAKHMLDDLGFVRDGMEDEYAALMEEFKADTYAITSGEKPSWWGNKPLTRDVAKSLLDEAGGNKDKARQLAKKRGYKL